MRAPHDPAFVFLGGSWDPIARPRIYHSPADNGVPASPSPPSLPGGPTTLHLYIAEDDASAPRSAPGAAYQPLFEAWGAERCGWDLEFDVEGAASHSTQRRDVPEPIASEEGMLRSRCSRAAAYPVRLGLRMPRRPRSAIRKQRINTAGPGRLGITPGMLLTVTVALTTS